MKVSSRHYGLIPAGLLLLAALLAFAQRSYEPNILAPDAPLSYENARFGFALSYLAGSTGATERGRVVDDDASVSFARNGAMLQIEVYEPRSSELGMTLNEFVASAVEGADLVGPTTLGDQEAMVVVFGRAGKLEVGGKSFGVAESDVVFLKRPTYIVYAMLRGGTMEERRELASILQSIRFQ